MVRAGLQIRTVAAVVLACGCQSEPRSTPPTPAPAVPPTPRYGAPGEPLEPLPVARPLPPPKDPATALVISGGHAFITCARLASGAVTCWGGPFTTPHRIAGWTDIVKVAFSAGELCGLHGDGRVECGDLPPALAADHATLRMHAIGGMTSAIDLAGAGDAMCVLEKTGDVACRVDGQSVTRTRLHHAASLVMGELEEPDFQFPGAAFACALTAGNLACIDIFVPAEASASEPPMPGSRYAVPAGTTPKLVLGAPHIAFAGVTEVLPRNNYAPLNSVEPLCARSPAAAAKCVTLDLDLHPQPVDRIDPFCVVNASTVVCSFDSHAPISVTLDHLVQVTNDGSTACALYGAGAVACWGNDEHGQLGRGGGAPNAPAWGLHDAIDIAYWGGGVLALRGNGQLAYWGYGVVDSGVPKTAVPITLSDIRDATQLVAGHMVACALRRTGAVACWGAGGLPLVEKELITDVTALHDIRELTATDFGVLARTADGTMLHVGDPQLGPSAAKTPTPIKGAERSARVVVAGSWICVLDHAPGPVRCWQETPKATSPQIVVATDVVELVGTGTEFPNTTARSLLIARLGNGRTLGIDLHMADGKPVATTTELAADVRAVFTSRSMVCARTATDTTCTIAEGVAPPIIPHGHEGARVLIPVPPCALTSAGVVVCFGEADAFEEGTGRAESRVPVPIALD